MSRPAWARDAPDRSVYVSNASGTTEVYAWDRATDVHRRVTDRRSGTHTGTVPPDGETVWWFADTDGDELGHWVREPFGGLADGSRGGAGAPRRRGRLPGGPGDRPRRSSRPGPPPTAAPRSGCAAVTARPRPSTRTRRTPGSARCPRTRRCWRSATPSTATPGTRPCASCASPTGRWSRRSPTATGLGLTPLAFAPVPGDGRLLLLHERHGREELLLWDVVARHRDRARARPARRARRRLLPRRRRTARLAHPRRPHPAAPLRPGHR